jgi:hypothetical protein
MEGFMAVSIFYYGGFAKATPFARISVVVWPRFMGGEKWHKNCTEIITCLIQIIQKFPSEMQKIF